MNTKSLWQWSYSGPKGQFNGYVQAVDPRDALSRALTTETSTGALFGTVHGVPISVLQDAPANHDARYEITSDGYSMLVQKVVCPSSARQTDDIVGCGSANVGSPDDEGLFDCMDCGMYFNPLTANAP